MFLNFLGVPYRLKWLKCAYSTALRALCWYNLYVWYQHCRMIGLAPK